MRVWAGEREDGGNWQLRENAKLRETEDAVCVCGGGGGACGARARVHLCLCVRA